MSERIRFGPFEADVNAWSHAEVNRLITTRPEAVIHVGRHARLNGCTIVAADRVDVGADCVLGSCEVRDHLPYSESPVDRRRPGQAQPVVIEENVWIGGQVSVPTRDLDLKGVATLASSETANEFDLPFVVQGPWDDPIMLPDAQSLIRRSSAAAPLLESIKSRSAGSAVRSVIDKLLANPTGAAAPPAPVPKNPD